MFQSKVREVIIQTVHNDVHEVHAFLQFRDLILPLPLHSIQQRGNTGSAHDRSVGIFISGLFPKPKGSLVGGQELNSDLVVPSDICGGIIEVLFDLIRPVGLEGRGKVEGNRVSVENGGLSGGRHSRRRLVERKGC
jgi:hypothetical protein